MLSLVFLKMYSYFYEKTGSLKDKEKEIRETNHMLKQIYMIFRAE